jgi:hypothetical protein
MRTVLLVVAAMVALSAVDAQAQTASSRSKLVWDQDAASRAEAQAYAYRTYSDGSTGGVIVSGVLCAGTVSPFVCEITFPTYAPGQHTVAMSAANAAGESATSLPLSFTYVVVPSSPRNLRIVAIPL